MAKYCEAKNIDLKDTIAFGDEENDRGLLETAGCGVCLLNGAEEIKKISDAITEYDADHKAIVTYKMNYEKFIYRVFKYKFDGFYFEKSE